MLLCCSEGRLPRPLLSKGSSHAHSGAFGATKRLCLAGTDERRRKIASLRNEERADTGFVLANTAQRSPEVTMSPRWHEGGLPRPLQLSKGSSHANSGGSQRQREYALQELTNGGLKDASCPTN